jgi:hypothetical protein
VEGRWTLSDRRFIGIGLATVGEGKLDANGRYEAYCLRAPVPLSDAEMGRLDNGGAMAGVDLIVAALAAGASAGLTDAASSAIRDTYTSLREAVRQRLADDGDESRNVLEASEVEPGVWEGRLRAVLEETGADGDVQILSAARSLLSALEVTGRLTGTHVVDASQAKGVQVGDHNTQTNTFT